MYIKSLYSSCRQSGNNKQNKNPIKELAEPTSSITLVVFLKNDIVNYLHTEMNQKLCIHNVVNHVITNRMKNTIKELAQPASLKAFCRNIIKNSSLLNNSIIKVCI